MRVIGINKSLSFFLLQQIKFLLALSFIVIFVNKSFSEIVYVGGELKESQTWTNDNVYVVISDLTISKNITLTIDQGVVVKINYGRGIIVDYGVLRALGTETDSVKFIPNYIEPEQSWNWKGITVKSIFDENYLHFVRISNARIGLKLENSHNFIIENSSIINCQLGVQFVNSSSCSILNCCIENNIDGIELSTSLSSISSDNTIYDCVIKNRNSNIYIFIEKESKYQYNIISNNLIGYGSNGLWIDDNAGSGASDNIIEHNIILNNGKKFGYGLFLGQGNTIVRNNIFWNNNIAIFSEQKGDNNIFQYNSFYQNAYAIDIVSGIEGNMHFNNTFSLNSVVMTASAETEDIVFHNNNIMNTYGYENIVVNNTTTNFFIPDNYWGTTDTSQIDNLIYDKLDDDILGEFNYNPFLNIIDESNPISPPYNVVQQIVDDKLCISWNANEEQDLMGYKVYYGNYNNYSFSESNDIGIDTIFEFSEDISIFSQVAITAYDSIVNTNSQTSGHESPFAFAVLYPYAGHDTLICSNLQELSIETSNIPMEYDSLFWSTSGDGLFRNSDILDPIYIMGILDNINGGALISLNVVIENDTLSDSFILSLKKDPIAFAGNDTLILPNMGIELVEARAHNFDSIMWISSGDGSFNDNNLLNPVYNPGNNDIDAGIVFLKIMAYSSCGSVSDSIKIIIEPYNTVKGRIWHSQVPINSAVVIAFMENEEGVTAMQIKNVESDGTYMFEGLINGNYYLYAIPDTINSDNVIPGYYANKLRWQSAYLLPVYSDVYDVDIHLSSTNFNLQYGQASISGHMEMPLDSNFNRELYCMPWLDDSNNDFCYGGLSNNTVLLFNQSKTELLDYTLTDEEGNFYFDNLPYGNYIVDAERAGLLSIASPIINLSPDHNAETGIIIEINQQNLKIYFDSNASDEFNLNVFPNPASHEIHILYSNPFQSTSRLEVFDLFGNLVLEYDIQTNNSLSKIDINALSSGLYFGQIINLNKTAHFRFVKR